jgi:hypothetical protein
MNRHQAWIYTIILLLCFSACKERKNKVQHIDTDNDKTITDTLLQKINTRHAAYAEWKDFYEEMYGSINLKNFSDYSTATSELNTTKAELPKDFFKKYGPLLVYSKDSSRFIDLFSYGYIIEPNKEGKLVARRGEPDQEVSIVNPKSDMRTRVLFCGTACSIESGTWINNDVVALYGLTSENGDDIYTPVIWFINTATGAITTYYYHESSELPTVAYLEKLMNKKGIELIPED